MSWLLGFVFSVCVVVFGWKFWQWWRMHEAYRILSRAVKAEKERANGRQNH